MHCYNSLYLLTSFQLINIALQMLINVMPSMPVKNI